MRREPKQDRARETVERILVAGAHLFSALGYEATTTNDIAATASVSIGSLYQYFPNKQAILSMLYDRHLDAVGPAVVSAARSRPAVSAATWTAELVEALVVANDSDLDRLLYQAVPLSEDAREGVEQITRDMIREAGRHFRRWGVRSAAKRAELAIVTAVTLIHEVVIQKPPGRDRDLAAAHLCDMIEAFITTSRRP
jgi:AcrR family transcriptional regulator